MLKAEECVLVFVDVQGKLAQTVIEPAELEQSLATLISGVALFDIPILWVEQLPEKLGSTSDILQQQLSPLCSPIAKSTFSAMDCEQFATQLSALKRQHVLLVGIETHICVYQTHRGLIDAGYHVHVVADGVSSRTAANKQLGLTMMQQSGAQLTNVESLLFELQQCASGERFKALLKLIK
ncbi:MULTISPECIES: isochorismatase family protein [Shewanella]|uniref:isochorismatase family protein n=1 Tax=Shewanella TaxID=22 RepID=UPI00048E2B40|nr:MULTISPECIES: isochorismatase family protein [Shewanella]QLE87706.1 isochorismatase family protein [Shewanella sp. Scap07]